MIPPRPLSQPILRRWRRLALLLGVVLLTACSSTTFVYNRLDFLLPWYLERYVDLDRDQARLLDAQLAPLLRWHRVEELPRYVALLDSLSTDLDTPLTLEWLQRRSIEFEDAWYRVRDRGLDELLLLGDRLSEDQIEEFLEHLEKQQARYERKYLERSEEEFREDADDNLRELLEDYLGRLGPAQRDQVRNTAQSLARSDATWLQERAGWIEIMRAELAREPGWQERVRTIIVRWEEQLDPETMALYDHNTLLVQQLIVEVVNARTEKQDRRLRRKLASLRDDLELLASQEP